MGSYRLAVLPALVLALAASSPRAQEVDTSGVKAVSEAAKKRAEEMKKAEEARKKAALDHDKAVAEEAGNWGKVAWDGCAQDVICPAEAQSGKLTKADLVGLYKEACVNLLGAQEYMRGWPDPEKSKLPLFVKNWYKELDAKTGPDVKSQRELRFKDILVNAVMKCRSGIQFECGTCTETSTSFKIMGPLAVIKTGSPDVQICPSACQRNRREVLTNLIHELSHYGGSDDNESVECLQPPNFEAKIPELAAEWDPRLAGGAP